MRPALISAGIECGQYFSDGPGSAAYLSSFALKCAHRVRFSPHSMAGAAKCGRHPAKPGRRPSAVPDEKNLAQ